MDALWAEWSWVLTSGLKVLVVVLAIRFIGRVVALVVAELSGIRTALNAVVELQQRLYAEWSRDIGSIEEAANSLQDIASTQRKMAEDQADIKRLIEKARA